MKASTFMLNILAERLSLAYKSVEEALKTAENLSASQNVNIEIQEATGLLEASAEHLKKALKQLEVSRQEVETSQERVSSPVAVDLEAEAALAYLVEAFKHEKSLLKAAGGVSGNNTSLIVGNTLRALQILAEGTQALYARSGGERLTHPDGECPPPCIRHPICIEVDWSCVVVVFLGIGITCVSLSPSCIAALLTYDVFISRCCERVGVTCVYWFSGVLVPCYGW